MQYELINYYFLINSCNIIKNISTCKDENALENYVQFDRNLEDKTDVNKCSFKMD